MSELAILSEDERADSSKSPRIKTSDGGKITRPISEPFPDTEKNLGVTATSASIERLFSKTGFILPGNLRSPGNAQVIVWISVIWEQLDQNIIKDSFDRCGITSSKMYDFHTKLQAFMEKNKVDMIENYDQLDEIESFFNNNDYSDVNLDSETNRETDFDDY
ncbi:hypothetical protein BpHYR1_044716 [Brachionus plicatilis]|uniref:Uncharacterized protein n=1 Tax=Brachionus plicatilis TaxID=10195 RepID=A0A3M7T1V9_BRAPC|nr:hypothetical protein BpHYR1_044716 [Brachionus plicatilis]